jgi:glycosyltransferase 2 family protein
VSAASFVDSHPRLWAASRWAAGIGLVALLLVGLDGGQVLDRIRAANVLLVAIGIVGLLAVHLLPAATWRILCLQLAGLRLAWASCLRLYYVAQALGGVTPANVGGDAYRVVAVRKIGLEWGAAAQPVIVQRATSYLALAMLALPALGWLAIASALPPGILAAGLLLCLLAAAVAVLLVVSRGWIAAVTRRLPWTTATGSVRPSPDPVERRHVSLASLGTATALAIGFHAASILFTALLVAAVDPSATGPAVLAAVTVARLSLAVPVLPSGLGANEAILSLLFSSLGLSPETALAGLLLGRLALVCTTLLGAGLLVFSRRHGRTDVAARGSAPGPHGADPGRHLDPARRAIRP